MKQHNQILAEMESSIKYKFVKMDLVQFATFAEGYKLEDAEIEFFNQFQFAYNFEEHLVLCKTISEISKEKKLLLKADIDCTFKIEEKSAESLENDTEAILPPILLAQFGSLAYGSLRGALYVKTIGTPFNSIILPPNDIFSIFIEPQHFNRKR